VSGGNIKDHEILFAVGSYLPTEGTTSGDRRQAVEIMEGDKE